MTESERDELQRKVEIMHQFFLDDVTNSRNLTRHQQAMIKSGIFFVGIEAKDLNLIDELGQEPQAKAYLKNALNDSVSFVRIKNTKGLLSSIGLSSDSIGYWMGKGIASSLRTDSQLILK